MNKYNCEYCNNSFTSYKTYMYKHKCKFTQANRLMRTNNKVVTMLDDLLTSQKMPIAQYIHYTNLRNKTSHDTLMMVSKIMNGENITH